MRSTAASMKYQDFRRESPNDLRRCMTRRFDQKIAGVIQGPVMAYNDIIEAFK